MAYTPLSDILASAVFNELDINTDFSSLSAAQKLQIANSSQQEICDLYNKKLFKNYELNTLATPALVTPPSPSADADLVEYVALSDITAQNIIDELLVNVDFNALSAATKLQLLNSAQSELSDMYVTNAKWAYKSCVMDPALTGIGLSGITSIVSAPVVFTDASIPNKAMAIIDLPNGIYVGCAAITRVPVGVSYISSVKILHSRVAAGNLSLKFSFSRFRKNVAVVVDGDAGFNNYTSGGSDGYPEEITVPAVAYSDIISLISGDLVAIGIERAAVDTYGEFFKILDIIINFS